MAEASRTSKHPERDEPNDGERQGSGTPWCGSRAATRGLGGGANQPARRAGASARQRHFGRTPRIAIRRADRARRPPARCTRGHCPVRLPVGQRPSHDVRRPPRCPRGRDADRHPGHGPARSECRSPWTRAKAPCTAFVRGTVKQGFYDGTSCHRSRPGHLHPAVRWTHGHRVPAVRLTVSRTSYRQRAVRAGSRRDGNRPRHHGSAVLHVWAIRALPPDYTISGLSTTTLSRSITTIASRGVSTGHPRRIRSPRRRSRASFGDEFAEAWCDRLGLIRRA
jgi:hypothetical protein